MSRLWPVLLLLSAACDGDDEPRPPAEPEATPAAREEPEPPTPEPSEAPAPTEQGPAPLRVTRVGGTVTAAGVQLEPGTRLMPGTVVETSAGSGAVLDHPEGGAVTLGPDSRVILGDATPFEVVVVRGHARGVLPPAGGSPRPPLRLGAPEATAEIPGSGDAWVAVAPDGTTFVAVLSGQALVGQGMLDGEGRPRRQVLGPGRAVTVRGTLPERSDAGPEHEDQVAGAMARALGRARGSDAQRRREANRALAALDEALEGFAAESARGESLTSRHREAVQAGERDQARELQRELVAHSQRVLRLRQALATRWERALAWTSLASVDRGARAEAVRGALR